YTADTELDMTLCSCRIWVEDSNQNRIAGDSNYHDCAYNQYGKNDHEIINLQNGTYWVHAKVEGSARKEKVRGPYTDNTCFRIYGTVGFWDFDQ
ncbi:9853_t:CDS:1, partial [Gigaspora margarita]